MRVGRRSEGVSSAVCADKCIGVLVVRDLCGV